MSKFSIFSVVNQLKNAANGSVTNIPLPDDELIDAYQARIGIIFHDDYKFLLKECGNIFYGTKDLLVLTKEGSGAGELETVLAEARLVGVPQNWLPICEDNGNYYCIVPSGEVKYWSHDGPTVEVWSDLATWVKEVWLEEG